MSQESEHPDQAPARRSDGDWPDEADIRGHILVPIVWWREILLVTALLAALGWAAGWGHWIFLAGYRTEAMVMVNPQTARVSAAGVSPADRSDTTNAIATNNRQGVLLGLVHQGEVVRAVLQRVSGQLNEKQRHLRWLLQSTDGELFEPQGRHGVSNLIRLETTADSQAKALAILGAWSEEYVRQINRLFSVPEGLQESIGKLLTESRETYNLAQRAWERHIERDRIDELKREIEKKTALIDLIQAGKRKSEELRIQAEQVRLEKSYRHWSKLRWLLGDAQGLRDLIESGGEASVESNRLAILLLKAQAFASTTALSDNLRLELGNLGAAHDNADSQRADIEALIAALQGKIEQLGTVIADQSKRLSNGAGRAHGNSRSTVGRERRSDPLVAGGSAGQPIDSSADTVASAPNDGAGARLIASLTNDIQIMRRKKEAIRAARANILLRRDQALNMVKVLERRTMDLDLHLIAADPRARLASPATVTTKDALQPFVVAILGGLIGLIGALVVAFSLNSAGLRPFLARAVSRD